MLVNRPLFGYGPDEDTTIERLNSSSPSYLQIPVVKKGFEDVYWAALLAYVGILGLITIAVLLLRIYTSAKKIFYRSKDEMVQNLSVNDDLPDLRNRIFAFLLSSPRVQNFQLLFLVHSRTSIQSVCQRTQGCLQR